LKEGGEWDEDKGQDRSAKMIEDEDGRGGRRKEAGRSTTKEGEAAE
jgi:hypothetical protein